jgi:hypothetical protein
MSCCLHIYITLNSTQRYCRQGLRGQDASVVCMHVHHWQRDIHSCLYNVYTLVTMISGDLSMTVNQEGVPDIEPRAIRIIRSENPAPEFFLTLTPTPLSVARCPQHMRLT